MFDHSFLVGTKIWGPRIRKLDAKFASPGCWHFYNGALSVIDNVLLEHGGLPHVLPLAGHLDFVCARWVAGVILRLFYSWQFCVRGLLHAQKL